MGERFGVVARKARIEKEVPLRRLAAALGWAPAYISDIERGHRSAPPREKARQWAELVGGDPEEFERLAITDRESVELPVQDHPELAVVLTRTWKGMTKEQEAEVLKVLRERRDR
jgi:transcriptional regulator with XRE-family HTH domain